MAWVPGGPDRPRKAAPVERTAPDADQRESRHSAPTTPLAGGQLLAAISTSIVALMREHYGRGPMRAKTYALDDIVVCVLRGSGFTALEQTIMNSGDGERVVAMRENFQEMMAKRYKDMIEGLTGRKVLAFISQAHVEPDITIEMFFIDRPLDGFGAVEVLDPPPQA
ncbi:MAG: DUF2294 domain-containing protein [Solirubrobacteraceae bacterium]